MTSAILLTDGDCGFCQKSANFLERKFPGPWVNDPSSSFDFARYGLTQNEVAKKVWLIVPTDNGHTNYSGAQAVAKLLLIQPKRFIKPFAVLAFLPITKNIADFGYSAIAKNRHRLFSASTSCKSLQAD